MNKLGASLLLAAGLICLDISPAAAHPHAENSYSYRDSYHYEKRRHNTMPAWLKRNKHFRHWYRHSPLKHYPRISWNRLYDIYRWERSYFASRRYMARDYGYRHDHDRRRYRDD